MSDELTSLQARIEEFEARHRQLGDDIAALKSQAELIEMAQWKDRYQDDPIELGDGSLVVFTVEMRDYLTKRDGRCSFDVGDSVRVSDVNMEQFTCRITAHVKWVSLTAGGIPLALLVPARRLWEAMYPPMPEREAQS